MLVEHLVPGSTRPAADGEAGELVVTSLTDPVVPLVRFRSGDLIQLVRDPCSCGRTLARYRPRGRAGDESVVGSRVILPSDVWETVEGLPATSSGRSSRPPSMPGAGSPRLHP
jgi:phenylacetate-CoA ligase